MKLVHTNDMVCHLWANRSQEQARNSNGSLYFNGAIIYSYGHHFPIARHLGSCILFTTECYSITTSQHKSKVRNAIPRSIPVFYVNDVLAETPEQHEENLLDMIERSNELLKKSFRARTNTNIDFYMDHAIRIHNHAIAYKELFHLKTAIHPIDDSLLDELKEKSKQEAIKQRKLNKKKREHELALLAERKEKAQEYLQRWINGEINSREFPYELTKLIPVSIRYNKDRDRVQSTMGAECPLMHARIAYSIVKQCRELEKPYSRYLDERTIRLGSFVIDSIDSSGNLKAGCHYIKWDEIKRFAESMQWL